MDAAKKTYNIGGARVLNPIWLAPLAGITTETYRRLQTRLGAALVHTEMVSAAGLSYVNGKTSRMLGHEGDGGDIPVTLQLFGPEADGMARGAEIALKTRKFDVIEINMACPMPKVTKKSGGASMLLNPPESCRMIASLKRFGLPVWAKIRKTEPSRHPLATGDFCAELLNAGVNLIIVHGRTPAQRYEGTADKGAVISVAREFPGMISASGDFYEPRDAREYLDGGCVSVLAARGVLRNVFLIPETLSYLGFPAEARYLKPSAAEQMNILIETGRETVIREGEKCAVVMTRKLLAGMLKGIAGVSRLRQECALLNDWASMEKRFKQRTDLRSKSCESLTPHDSGGGA